MKLRPGRGGALGKYLKGLRIAWRKDLKGLRVALSASGVLLRDCG